MTWTDDRVHTLIHRWRDGHSAAVIAAELGISRNAVIGKVHRLALPCRTTVIAQRPPRASRAPRVTNARPSARSLTARSTTPKPRRLTEPPTLGPAPAMVVTSLTLAPESCNWPYGDPKDPGFHFCGRDKPKGRAYCAHHAALAYR